MTHRKRRLQRTRITRQQCPCCDMWHNSPAGQTVCPACEKEAAQ